MTYPPPFQETWLQQYARERVYPHGTSVKGFLLFIGSFLAVYIGAWVMVYGATVMWPLAVLGALMLAAGFLGLLAPVYAIRAHGRKSHHDHLVRMAKIYEEHHLMMRTIFAANGLQYSEVDNSGHLVVQGEVVSG